MSAFTEYNSCSDDTNFEKDWISKTLVVLLSIALHSYVMEAPKEAGKVHLALWLLAVSSEDRFFQKKADSFDVYSGWKWSHDFALAGSPWSFWTLSILALLSHLLSFFFPFIFFLHSLFWKMELKFGIFMRFYSLTLSQYCKLRHYWIKHNH